MNLKSLKDEAIRFFTLAIGEAEEDKKLRIRYLREASIVFLSNPSEGTAAEVYNSFFDCYQMRNEDFAFFDILDALREYELASSSFVQNKRDHFTHSVWVFFMGLGVFSTNASYRAAFARSTGEFLYEWGLVSLLHDIGYPVEISFQQFRKYIEEMIDIDGDSVKPDPYFEYKNFGQLIHLYGNEGKSFIDLLADYIANSLDLDQKELAEGLYNYPNIRGTRGFIDHGFYSAIMLMHWNGMLKEHSKLEDSFFSQTTVNAASAILLHNYYKRPLVSEHSLPPLSAKSHPLAFLIMLCDELQEWDRTAYGRENQKKPLVEEFEFNFSERDFNVEYELSLLAGADKEGVAEKFSQGKIDTLLKLLDLREIFPDLGQAFVTSSIGKHWRNPNVTGDRHMSPRPLFEDLESVGQVLHENYRKKYKDSPQGRKKWDECDDHYKYDNISQARHLFNAIASYGYIALGENSDIDPRYIPVASIDDEFIEDFGREEHDRWMSNKIQDGWTYGETRDDDKRLHPLIVDYDDLPEYEKDKDRAPLKEFVDTLRSIGKGLYKLR